MKKGVILLSLLILVGCGEKKVEPIKETVDTIHDSKKSVVALQVNNLLKEAEMKLLGSVNNCVLAKELSGNASDGSICYDTNGNIYAKDVKIDGFICNGTHTNLSCVGDSSDK